MHIILLNPSVVFFNLGFPIFWNRFFFQIFQWIWTKNMHVATIIYYWQSRDLFFYMGQLEPWMIMKSILISYYEKRVTYMIWSLVVLLFGWWVIKVVHFTWKGIYITIFLSCHILFCNQNIFWYLQNIYIYIYTFPAGDLPSADIHHRVGCREEENSFVFGLWVWKERLEERRRPQGS